MGLSISSVYYSLMFLHGRFRLIGLFYIFVNGVFLYVIKMRIMKPREFCSIKMGLCICISDCFDIIRFVRKIIPNRLTTLRMRVMNPHRIRLNKYVCIYICICIIDRFVRNIPNRLTNLRSWILRVSWTWCFCLW